jgi:5-methylcytosine-specific restriction protein B
LNSEELYSALIHLGFTATNKDNKYAYEFNLGNGDYIYVKSNKYDDGSRKLVDKDPLVIHPHNIKVRLDIDALEGINVNWTLRKSSNYKKFPLPSDNTSPSGYAMTVDSPDALNQLIELITKTKLETAESNISLAPSKGTHMPYAPLNQILYGPPGTGKTFNATSLAVQIADPTFYKNLAEDNESDAFYSAVKQRYDELVRDKRIMFTTFHQSFSYEDFIEGIRAVADDTGVLSYKTESGVFKQLCEFAEAKVTQQSSESVDISGRRYWKMSLGNTLEDDDSIYLECIESDYILLGYGDDIDFSDCTDRASIKNILEIKSDATVDDNNYTLTSVHYFKNIIKKGDIVVISDGNQKFRAIAEITGNYELLETEERVGYQQKRSVKWLRQYEPSLPREKLFKKSLSQMTLYSLKSSTIDLDKLQAILTPDQSASNSQLPHVLIIDEINRGNIARIFGELITLLEDSKRQGQDNAMEVTLPYSKKAFSVPSNIYVIGTMNTADRSLAQLDIALRRRFSFIDMPPKASLLTDINIHGINLDQLLSTINERIEVLLDSDHLIGHSYFLPLKNKEQGSEQEKMLASIFTQNILPLLQEYFFDDWERIGWVLNDHNKSVDNKFIHIGGDSNISDLFGQEIQDRLSDKRFRVNKYALNRAAAYQGILSTSNEIS